jgi:hypothetical protein
VRQGNGGIMTTDPPQLPSISFGFLPEPPLVDCGPCEGTGGPTLGQSCIYCGGTGKVRLLKDVELVCLPTAAAQMYLASTLGICLRARIRSDGRPGTLTLRQGTCVSQCSLLSWRCAWRWHAWSLSCCAASSLDLQPGPYGSIPRPPGTPGNEDGSES